MAITNEQMNIYLGVDATIASKELEKISGELGKTNSSMKELQGTSDSLNTNLLGLAGSQAVLGNGMFASNMEMQSLTSASRELATAFELAKNKSKQLIETEDGRLRLLEKGASVAKVAAVASGLFLTGLGGFNLLNTISKDSKAFNSELTSLGSNFSKIKTDFSNIQGIKDSFDSVSKVSNGLFKNIGELAQSSGKAIKSAFIETLTDIPKIFSSVGSGIKHMGDTWVQTSIEIASYGPIIASAFGIMEESIDENKGAFSNLADQVSNFGGVATIGFTIAMHTIAEIMASSLSKIGSTLRGFIAEFEGSWAMAEQSAKSFGFTLQGFQKTFGEAMIGTTDQWSKLMHNIQETTNFSLADIEKASQLVVAENTAIGISFDDNAKFIERATEIAANKSMDLTDVVMRLQAGLLGSSQAVGVLAINLGAHSIEHSKLNKEFKKTIGTMSEIEKQQIRLSEIFRQTEPIVGSIVDAQTNYIQVNKKLALAIEVLKIKLGTINFLLVGAKSLWADAVKSFSKLPKVFFEVAGGSLELLSIITTLTGALISMVFTITSASVAYGILNRQMSSNLKLQAFMDMAFSSSPIKASIAPVKQLTDVFKNLGSIFKAIVFTLGAGLIPALVTGISKLSGFLVYLVKSPFFMGAALMIAGITTVAKALQEMNDEFDFLNRLVTEFTPKGNGVEKLMGKIGLAITSVFTGAISIIKILVISLAEVFQVIRLLATGWGQLFAGGGDTQTVKKLELINSQLDAMFQSHTKYVKDLGESLGNILFGFSIDEAFAGAGDGNAKLQKIIKSLEDVAFRKEQINNALSEIDFEGIKINVLGTEVEKLKHSFEIANAEVDKYTKEMTEAAEVNSETINSFKKASSDQAEAAAKITKMTIDSLKEIKKVTEEVNKNSIKNSKDESLAIIADFEEKKNKVKEFETALSALGPVAGASAAEIIKAYSTIEKAKKSALSEAGQKKIKEALEEEIKQAKAQAELMDTIGKKNYELQQQALGDTLTERQKIVESLRYESEEVDRQIKQYTTLYGENSKVVQLLEKQKGLMQEAALVQKDMADMSFSDWIDELNVALTEAFSVKTIADFVTFLQESFKEISDSPIVVRIKKVVDEATSAVSSTASSVVSDVGAMGGGAVGEVAAKAGEVIKAGADVAMAAGSALVSGIAKAGGWIGQIVDIVMNADKYLKILLDMPKMIFSVLEKLPGMMLEVAKTFPQMITKIAEALPGILIQIVNAIPGLIEGLLSALPVLIERLAEAFPEIFIKLVSMIPKIVTMLIKAVAKGIQALMKGLIRGIGNMISGKKIKIPDVKVDQKAIKQVARIAGDSSKMFDVKDLAEQVKSPMQGVTDGVIEAFDIGSEKQLNGWQKTGAMLTKWSNEVEGVFTNLWAALLGAVGFIGKIIGNIFATIFKAFKDIFDEVARFLNKILSGIGQALIDLFAGVGKALGDIVNAIVKAVYDVFNAVAEALKLVFDGVRYIFDQIILAFKELWELAKEAFASIVKAIGDIFTAAIKAIKDTFDTVIKAFADLWEGLKNAVSLAWQFVKDLWEGLKNVVALAWQFVKDLWEGLKEVVSLAWQFVKDLWEGLKNVVALAWQFVKDLWEGLKNVVSLAWQFVKDLWEGLKEVVSLAWQFVKDLWEGLKNVVSQAWQFVKDLWEGLKNVVSQAWQFVKDLWEGLKNIVSGAFQFVKDIFDSLGAGVKVAFQFVKDIFDGLKAVVTSAFEGIKTIGSDIWEGFKTAISGGADFIKGFGTKIWEGLKEGLSGLGKIFSDMFDALNPANLMKKVFNFDGATGQETVERALNIDIPFLNFARGGVVPGQSKVKGDSIKNDNVIAMLSPGEVVIPRSKMDDPRTRKIIEDVMTGSIQLPGFFSGRIKISTPKIPSISDIIDTAAKAADDIGIAIEVASAQASDAGAILNQQVIAGTQVAIDQATGIAQGAGDWLGDVFNDANPLKQLWETVSNKVKKEMLDPMFQKNKFAAGGPVGTDTVPAMLTPGEFIMSRPAVNSIGLDNLRSMNAGKPAAAGNQTVNIEINFNDVQISMDKNLIRDKLIPEIRDALKRASLNGEFVLSNKGIRA